MNRRGHKDVSWVSYIIPIALALLLIVVFANILFRSSSEEPRQVQADLVTVTPVGESSEVTITYAGDKSVSLQVPTEVYVGEKISVVDGVAEAVHSASPVHVNLKKNARIMYTGMSADMLQFELQNSEAWVRAQ